MTTEMLNKLKNENTFCHYSIIIWWKLKKIVYICTQITIIKTIGYELQSIRN